MVLRMKAATSRRPLHETAVVPPGASRKHIGRIRPLKEVAQRQQLRNAAPVECSGAFTTGCWARDGILQLPPDASPSASARIEVQQTAGPAGFEKGAIDTCPGDRPAWAIHHGRLPLDDLECGRLGQTPEAGWREEPEMVQCRVVTPGPALQSEPALPALELRIETGQIRHANQEYPTRRNELAGPTQLEERVPRVLEHMIEPYDVVARVAEVNRRQLSLPEPGAARAGPAGDHHVGALDIPAAVAREPQKGASPATDVKKAAPPSVEPALETHHLTRVVPLMPVIGGRFVRTMVVGTVDGGRHLFEHRSRTVELQPTGHAPREMKTLKVGGETHGAPAAQRTQHRFTIW